MGETTRGKRGGEGRKKEKYEDDGGKRREGDRGEEGWRGRYEYMEDRGRRSTMKAEGERRRRNFNREVFKEEEYKEEGVREEEEAEAER